MLIKKSLTFTSTFIFLLTILLLNAYSYNSSYSDLVIDPNSWCANQEITIKVYNATDFENRKEIKSDLCDSDENPQDDNCLAFKNITDATVKIYNGPLESLGLLLDTKTSKEGEFTTTFPDVSSYYYEITPKGNYNELTGYFEGIDCKFSSSTNSNESSEIANKKLYNLSFTDSQTSTFIKIENTEINKTSEIVVSNIENISLRNLPELDYKIYKTIEVKAVSNIGAQINYTSLTIDTQLSDTIINERGAVLKVFKYDESSSSWKENLDFNDYNNKIVITNANFGIYSITKSSKIVDEQIVQETPSVISNEVDTNNENSQNELIVTNNINNNSSDILIANSNVDEETKSNLLIYLFIIILIIVGVLIGIAIVHHNKEKKVNENKTQNETELKSYTDISEKATQYIKKYKKEYTKDQLYRALKEANVPTDVIDKIFAREY